MANCQTNDSSDDRECLSCARRDFGCAKRCTACSNVTSNGETSAESEAPPTEDTAPEASRGLAIESVFCPEEVKDPFDTVEWELRSAAIKGEKGEVVFEQEDCEIPASWG